jgi:hypothetical protein
LVPLPYRQLSVATAIKAKAHGLALAQRITLSFVRIACQRYGRAGSYRRDGLLARFGADIALPGALGHAARGSLTWPASRRRHDRRRSGVEAGRIGVCGAARAAARV